MQQEHEDTTVRTAQARRTRLPEPGGRTRLVMASALMLFVELALIRWTSSNNLYLVHLTNFVLLASFLDMKQYSEGTAKGITQIQQQGHRKQIDHFKKPQVKVWVFR